MSNSYKSRGIVLHSVKYSDKGYVVYLFTEQFGRRSFWVNSLRNGKPTVGGKVKLSLQPLTILDFVAKDSAREGLSRLVELSRSQLLPNLLTSYVKSTIALFVAELFYRCVRSDESNPILFDFLYHSIEALDSIEEGVQNFHIYFMLQLIRFLGYYPKENYTERCFFDLTKGEYVIIRPKHNMYIEMRESQMFYALQQSSLNSLSSLEIDRAAKGVLVEAMLAYLNYHQHSNIKLSSIEVLKEMVG